ncbi:MAG: acyl-CoA dehydrogenase [Proteobacteria bacterium]|nr:acyl-CoA dehydrogenase [Pseudomonadota bacterium]
MDFSLTAEQIDIQKAAREFARGEFDPDRALEYDENQEFPSAVWRKACELGFIGVQFPEESGGQGLGLLENTLIVETFCRQDSGIGMALALSDFGSEMILRHGDDSQKRQVLPVVARGKGTVTMAFLEEGYALAPFATTAALRKGGYVIDGVKTFVPLGRRAHFIVVICQVGSDDPFAQSAILVERQTDGLTFSSMGEKMGMRMVPVDRVSFKSVKVPRDNQIGPEGTGYSQLRGFFDEMRVETGAMGVGIAQGGLDRALEYSKGRVQFGKPIVAFGVIRNKLADMTTEVEMARLITYKAAWSFDTGRPDQRLTAMSKMVASKAAYRTNYEAVQIHGGTGYMTESHIERFYRDAKVLDLFVEPEQLQKNLLADLLTGKTN